MAFWLNEEKLSGNMDLENFNKHLVLSILNELLRLNSIGNYNKMVEFVRKKILAKIKNPIYVSDLAKSVGMSKYSFIRKYRSFTGKTPMEEVTNIRISYAKDLIFSTPMTLKEIAVESGFGDVFQMTKIFKKKLGTTPGNFRRE